MNLFNMVEKEVCELLDINDVLRKNMTIKEIPRASDDTDFFLIVTINGKHWRAPVHLSGWELDRRKNVDEYVAVQVRGAVMSLKNSVKTCDTCRFCDPPGATTRDCRSNGSGKTESDVQACMKKVDGVMAFASWEPIAPTPELTRIDDEPAVEGGLEILPGDGIEETCSRAICRAKRSGEFVFDFNGIMLKCNEHSTVDGLVAVYNRLFDEKHGPRVIPDPEPAKPREPEPWELLKVGDWVQCGCGCDDCPGTGTLTALTTTARKDPKPSEHWGEWLTPDGKTGLLDLVRASLYDPGPCAIACPFNGCDNDLCATCPDRPGYQPQHWDGRQRVPEGWTVGMRHNSTRPVWSKS
jgi:hypothetical protein